MKRLAIALFGLGVIGYFSCVALEVGGRHHNTDMPMYAAIAFVAAVACARMAWSLSDSIEREAAR